MKYFFDQLMANIKAGDLATANVEKWEPSSWPAEASQEPSGATVSTPGARVRIGA